MRNAAGQVVLDQAMHTPFMYFPAFYLMQSLVMGGILHRPSKDNFVSLTLQGWTTYRSNIAEDMVACWKVYIPAQILNFAFTPMYLRAPFINVVGLLWTGLWMSYVRGDPHKNLETSK